MNYVFFEATTVDAGAMNNITETPVIPDGKICKLKSFGGCDINVGDSKSSLWVLQWGKVGEWENIAILSLTGDTKSEPIDESFKGDGTKKFRVIRRNYSGTIKELPFWIKGQLG